MCKLAWFPSIDRLNICQYAFMPFRKLLVGFAHAVIRCPPFTPSDISPLLLCNCTQEEIPDVERNGHCFSDGVGEISRELLQACLARVPFGYQSVEDVSAVQVRWFCGFGVLSS